MISLLSEEDSIVYSGGDASSIYSTNIYETVIVGFPGNKLQTEMCMRECGWGVLLKVTLFLFLFLPS